MSSDPVSMSMSLSKILGDIGVNEEMVKRTRMAYLLRESLNTVSHRCRGIQQTVYTFGSVTEGSTIKWLGSDDDYLIFNDSIEVVCDLKECTQNVYLIMSNDDPTPPGYCHLRLIISNHPDQSSEQLLLTHITYLPAYLRFTNGEEYELHGPAFRMKGRTSYNDQDYVDAYYCKTWPNAARKWLKEDGVGQWPTKEMKYFAEHSGCFIVPVGSKGSKMEEYEYRVSTSLAERCLMFSLNITQLRCFILMKIILKEFINTKEEDNVVSSYICKNLLFHCIRHTPSSLWKASNLLDCLTLCLSSLQYCVLIGNCPHFIIHDNNLLFRRTTSQFKAKFLTKIGDILLSRGVKLLRIIYKLIGNNLGKDKGLCTEKVCNQLHGILLRDTGKTVQDFYLHTLFQVKYKGRDVAITFLSKCVFKLIDFHKLGSQFERLACKLLAAELSSTIGSLLASRNIVSASSISKISLEWLDASLDSNVSSNRLKKASVFYCVGKMKTALSIVQEVERRYDLNAIEPVCRCTTQSSYPAKERFNGTAERYNEDGFRYVVAFCVNFLRCESKCMPKELRLEMFRTTAAEQPLRHFLNQRFDLELVDSLTYLLFLKYKIYGRLGEVTEQDQALKNLISVIYFEPNLGHRETGFNLVGQIMVEKGHLGTALLFFLLSYKVQAKFNAAKIHICIVLATLFEKYTQDYTIRV